MDRPERPESGITPFLGIRDNRAEEAVEFYGRAFGGEAVERNVAQDGKRLMQASLKINGAWLMLSDEFPEFGYKAEPPASVTLHLQVDDADRWWERIHLGLAHPAAERAVHRRQGL